MKKIIKLMLSATMLLNFSSCHVEDVKLKNGMFTTIKNDTIYCYGGRIEYYPNGSYLIKTTLDDRNNDIKE